MFLYSVRLLGLRISGSNCGRTGSVPAGAGRRPVRFLGDSSAAAGGKGPLVWPDHIPVDRGCTQRGMAEPALNEVRRDVNLRRPS
jgi:hypothetical protein